MNQWPAGIALWGALIGVLTTTAGGLAAEGSAPGTPESSQQPLATKQQIVRDRMAQLEDRMYRLSEQLAAAEPQQAERLSKALQRARQLLISRHMEETIALLDQNELSGAADRQMAIMKDLEQVLKLLLEDPDNKKERDEEIKRLEAYRKQVAEMLRRQRELKAQADAAPRLARMLAGLQAAIARLEKLIAEQQQTTDHTRQAAQAGDASAAAKLAESQKQIRSKTESLNQDLSNPARMGDQSSSGEESGESTPGSPAQGSSPPSGTASQPETERSGTPEHTDDHHGRDEHEDSAEPAENRVERGIQKARDELGQASGEMKAAEQELGNKAAADAVPVQKKAGESLERALHQLKQQEKQARQLLDQAEAARQQRQLEQQAGKLAEEMKGDAQAGENQSPSTPKEPNDKGGQGKGESKDGQQGDGEQGQSGGKSDGGKSPPKSPKPPAPGRQNVEQAGKHMEDAAQDLDQNKPVDASPDQQRAIEELEQAQRELEQVLEQLRREQQEEILRGLESRFRGMLARQLTINKGTTDLDAKGQAAWTHADELTLAGLALDEANLANEAGEALHILKEDATTIVFPRIVEQLRGDMQDVSGRLKGRSTGAGTQALEAEIVTTLEELIDAIKEMRQQLQSGEGGSPGGGGGGQNAPLLPDSAELKLLRSLQVRVNHRTGAFFQAHGAPQERTSEQARELERIAERQKEVAEMARKMNERQTGQ